MTYKIKSRFIFIFSITLFIASLTLNYLIREVDICSYFEYQYISNKCSDYIDAAILIFLTLSAALFLPSLILLFCKEAIYRSWKWFAIPYLLLLTFLAWPHGRPSGGGLYDGYVGGVVNKESVLLILAGLFVFISLLIIIIKSIRLAGKTEVAKTIENRK